MMVRGVPLGFDFEFSLNCHGHPEASEISAPDTMSACAWNDEEKVWEVTYQGIGADSALSLRYSPWNSIQPSVVDSHVGLEGGVRA